MDGIDDDRRYGNCFLEIWFLNWLLLRLWLWGFFYYFAQLNLIFLLFLGLFLLLLFFWLLFLFFLRLFRLRFFGFFYCLFYLCDLFLFFFRFRFGLWFLRLRMIWHDIIFNFLKWYLDLLNRIWSISINHLGRRNLWTIRTTLADFDPLKVLFSSGLHRSLDESPLRYLVRFGPWSLSSFCFLLLLLICMESTFHWEVFWIVLPIAISSLAHRLHL